MFTLRALTLFSQSSKQAEHAGERALIGFTPGGGSPKDIGSVPLQPPICVLRSNKSGDPHALEQKPDKPDASPPLKFKPVGQKVWVDPAQLLPAGFQF